MTPKQIRQFWPAFARACDALGLTTSADKDAYRRQIMLEEASAYHWPKCPTPTAMRR